MRSSSSERIRRAVPAAGLALVLACSASAPPIPKFDATRAVVAARRQCAWGPRVPGTPARDSVAAWIVRTLERCGARVDTQRVVLRDPWADTMLTLVNVTGRFGPDSPRLMLAAHYDSRPWADAETTEARRARPVPGAVDGAAGVGILLEIARLAAATPPPVGLELVFFDGEDYGKPDRLDAYLLGSRAWARAHAHDPPRLAILVDMVGGRGTVVAREGTSHATAPAVLDTIFARARALGLRSFVDRLAPAIHDDHIPLIDAGIRAVDLFGYNYAAWHTLDDTPRQIDRERVDEVGRLLAHLVYRPPF